VAAFGIALLAAGVSRARYQAGVLRGIGVTRRRLAGWPGKYQ